MAVDSRIEDVPVYVEGRNVTACVIVFIVRDDRVLLARRGTEPSRGEWDTVGGFVDQGESAEEAVVRETAEETELQVTEMNYLGSVADFYGDSSRPILHLCFLAGVSSGEPNAKSDVASLSWVPLAGLPSQLAFPRQADAFRLLRKRLSGTPAQASTCSEE